MINLKTCNRQEFVTAYKALEKEIKSLKLRLSEYEGIQSDDDKEIEFQRFWKLYGRKGSVKATRDKFIKLSKKKKEKIFEVVTDYVKSTPDRNFRKGGESWLNKECWNDVIESEFKQSERPKVGAFAINPIANRKAELKELRQKSKSVNIRDRLNLN